MLSGTYGPWYLQGRQFGLCLVSQRPLGKLSSFYSFYALLLCYFFSYFSSRFILYLVYYYIFLLPVFILFHFIFYAYPLEVKPLNNSQTVTEQRTNIDR